MGCGWGKFLFDTKTMYLKCGVWCVKLYSVVCLEINKNLEIIFGYGLLYVFYLFIFDDERIPYTFSR